MWQFLLTMPAIAQSVSCAFQPNTYDHSLNEYVTIEPLLGQASVSLQDLVANATLLDAHTAETTPQFLIITCQVIVDQPYTFAPGSELVFLTDANPTGLEVQSALTLDGCHLHGMNNKVWDGVHVLSDGTLSALYNCIEDARKGIALDFFSYSEIIGNHFRRNHTAIYAGSETGTLTRSIFQYKRGGITANNISGADTLIEQVAGVNRPVFGIRARNVLNLLIGVGIDPSLNEIHDFNISSSLSSMSVGIDLENTNATIQGTRFNKIGMNSSGDSFGGTAIRATSTGAQRTLRVLGLGENSATSTFNLCEQGISTKGCRLNVQHCLFEETYQTQIEVLPSSIQHRFDIAHNKFRTFRVGAINISAGVYGPCRIDSNRFEHSTSFITNASLGAFGTLSQPLGITHYLRITGNTFIDLPKSVPSGGLNVVTLSLTFVNDIADVRSNTFDQQTQTTTSSGTFDYSSIVLAASNRNKVIYNTFTGVTQNEQSVGLTGVSGVYTFNCSGNKIRCNTFNGIWEGARFEGFGCDGSDVLGNVFTNNRSGLLMASPMTRIGVQDKKHNQWPETTTSPDFEAFWEAPAFGMPALSRFLVETADMTSVFWPDPVMPANDWFKPGTIPVPPVEIPPFYDYCLQVDDSETPTASDDSLLLDHFPIYRGYTELAWEAGFDFYGRLVRNPGLRPTNSSADTFFSTHSSDNLGKLYDAMQQYGAIGAVPDSLTQPWDSLQEQITNRLAEINDKQAQMLTASTTELEELKDEVVALTASLDTTWSNYQALADTCLSKRQTKAAQLATYLSAIEPTASHEHNLKTVLTILADVLTVNSDSFSTAQIDSLEEIAAQCRYAGGYGVVLARIALKKQGLYNDENLCPDLSPRPSKVQGASLHRVTIAPNPVQDVLLLNISDRSEQGSFRLYNLMGGLALEQNLVPNLSVQTIQVGALPPGVYFYALTLRGQHTASGKVIKLSNK